MKLWAILTLLLARAAGADEYQTHCDRAQALFDVELYAQALVEWKSAYAVRQEPRRLYDMARAYQKLGRDRDASTLYRRYLVAEPSLDDDTRGELEARLALLTDHRPTLASLTPPDLPPDVTLVPVHYETRVRRGLVAAGIVLLSLGYLPGLLIGGVGLGCCSNVGSGAESSGSFGMLLLPVLGPFVSAAIGHESSAWWGPWILDGLGQVAGLAMLIAGVRRREQVPIFQRVTLLPTGTGLAAFGRF
jgi:hypothetical protein